MNDPILKTPAGNPLKLFVDISWDGDVARKLFAATRRLGDTSILRRTIGRKVVLSIRRNFMEQRTAAGAPWAPLKRRRGRGHNPGAKALFDSGKLYGSIDYELEEPDAVSIGFPHETWYGKFHQSGTKHIPARAFLGLRPDDLPTMQQTMASHAQQAFEGAGSA